MRSTQKDSGEEICQCVSLIASGRCRIRGDFLILLPHFLPIAYLLLLQSHVQKPLHIIKKHFEGLDLNVLVPKCLPAGCGHGYAWSHVIHSETRTLGFPSNSERAKPPGKALCLLKLEKVM